MHDNQVGCNECGAEETEVVYIGEGEFFCHSCGNVLGHDRFKED